MVLSTRINLFCFYWMITYNGWVMIDIKIKYQPFRFLKYTRNFEGAFPSTFAKLSRNQFIAISRLTNETISEIDFLTTMTGIRKKYIKLLSDYHRYNLMNLLDPFMDLKPYHAFIIPDIFISLKSFCCPKPKLSQVTFAQFIFVESYFTDYQNDKKPTDLHKFVASLYLRPNHSFNENEIAANAALISRVKTDVLEAIFFNYVLIREWLCVSYPLIFDKEVLNEKDEKHKKPPKKPGNSGWIKTFENVMGDDLVNHDRYAMLPLHNVFRWMTTKIKENIKLK